MRQVRPKKNLGQHFLTDLSIARAIADTVDACPDLPVLEVGPGMGVMTQYLVEKPRELKVVEIDRESVTYLKNTLFRAGESDIVSRREERGERVALREARKVISLLSLRSPLLEKMRVIPLSRATSCAWT